MKPAPIAPGYVVAGARIIRLALGRATVTCGAGHVWLVEAGTLRKARARGIKVHCRDCSPNRGRAPRDRSAESARRKVVKRGNAPCGMCSGLPHRRWEQGCPVCREPYAAEPPLLVTDMLRQQPVREMP